jgi:preprotein translocase subunit SecF
VRFLIVATPKDGEAGGAEQRKDQPSQAGQAEKKTTHSPQFSTPTAAAVFWVNRATVIAVSMVGPIIGGSLIDQWLGTTFVALVGIVVGMCLGIGQLLLLTRPKQ